jgi:hypothetical protein
MNLQVSTAESSSSHSNAYAQLARYPLLDAMLERRSRRFGKGLRLNGGPLAFESTQSAQPLSIEEEAALAYAACGITGHVLAELPYESGSEREAGSGNIMTHFVGRTVASGDAMHACIVFVINDDGVYMLKRPQDHPRSEIAALAEDGRQRKLVQLYEKNRVRISDKRLDVPREPPFVPPFNKWAANLPGTTYFLPVSELTAYYINILLTAFNEEFGYFMLDERNRFKPAGLERFARSRGGHLYNDASANRAGTVNSLETWVCEFAALEQGEILQNLALMTQALGLGGFPHFAAHPFIWFQTLGFRMEEIALSKIIGAGPVTRRLMRALKRDVVVPTAVGLERDDATLIKPYCPPYYRNMEEAVLAFVDYKYAQGAGTMRDGGAATAWQDGAKVQSGIPKYSDQTIAATIAYCDYVFKRYGRFPANSGPFRTVLAHQAHHLDLDFYERFYKPEALTDTQRQHPGH